MRDDLRVRKWITERLPGHFDSDSPQDCYRAAFDASGLADDMTLAAFRGALHLAGYQPVCVRTSPMLYRLSLPDGRSPGVKARAYRA